LRGLPRFLRADYVTFVATDSAWMQEILMRLPNAVARRQTFPPRGAGHQFSDFAAEGYSDRDSVADVVADMFLLSRCNALVYNSTSFHQYARTVTDYFNGNHTHIDRYYLHGKLRRAAGLALHARRGRRQA